MIQETFLPHLIFGKKKTLSPIVGALRKITVKKSGIRTPESSDASTIEVLKFPAGERGTGLGCDGGRGILQCRPPTDARGRNTRQKERSGRHIRNQTQRFSPLPQRY